MPQRRERSYPPPRPRARGWFAAHTGKREASVKPKKNKEKRACKKTRYRAVAVVKKSVPLLRDVTEAVTASPFMAPLPPGAMLHASKT